MAQNVLVTGAGRETAMGFNFVRRYLEQGDHVFATVRRPCEALEKLRERYPDTLDILEIDIGSTESVRAAAAAIAARVRVEETGSPSSCTSSTTRVSNPNSLPRRIMSCALPAPLQPKE